MCTFDETKLLNKKADFWAGRMAQVVEWLPRKCEAEFKPQYNQIYIYYIFIYDYKYIIYNLYMILIYLKSYIKFMIYYK
jgi:hypothetical protein